MPVLEPLPALEPQFIYEACTVLSRSRRLAYIDASHRQAKLASYSALIFPAVANASSLGPTPLAPLADTECEESEQALAVNLLGPLRLTKALFGANPLLCSNLF